MLLLLLILLLLLLLLWFLLLFLTLYLTHTTRACTFRPRGRVKERRRRWEVFKAHCDIQDDAHKPRWWIIMSTVFLTLTFSFISCTASCLLTYSYLDHGKFSKSSCSTNSHPGFLRSGMNVSLMERMTRQVREVISILLVRAGIETNPGTVYRMYLVHKPLTSELGTVLSI
jgi:hypothetical protein